MGSACYGGYTEVVQILLKPGANVNAEAWNSPESTLQYAAHVTVVELLHRAIAHIGWSKEI